MEKEISYFYQKYGKDGVVTISEAKHWISSKVKTTRLVFLNQTIYDIFTAAFDDFEPIFEKHLRRIIEKELQFFGSNLNIDDIIDVAWGADNLNWRKRLFNYKARWSAILNNDLKLSILTKDSIPSVLGKVGERSITMENAIKRLVRSESNAIKSITKQKIYKEKGIKKYRFCHIDGCTCEKCVDMEGHIFPVSEYEVGVTANPLHPNCGCDTIPL